MPCDEALVGRIHLLLKGRRRIAAKRMFEGVASLTGGHVFCGVTGRDVMARVACAAPS